MGCDCGGLSGGQAFATIGCHHPTWPNPDSSQTVSLGGSFPNFCGSSFHSCHSFLILCVSPLVKQITMIHNEYSWAHGFSFFQLSTCFRRTQKKTILHGSAPMARQFLHEEVNGPSLCRRMCPANLESAFRSPGREGMCHVGSREAQSTWENTYEKW